MTNEFFSGPKLISKTCSVNDSMTEPFIHEWKHEFTIFFTTTVDTGHVECGAKNKPFNVVANLKIKKAKTTIEIHFDCRRKILHNRLKTWLDTSFLFWSARLSF